MIITYIQRWLEDRAAGMNILLLFFGTVVLSALLLSKPFGSAEIEANLSGMRLLESRVGYTSDEAHEVFGAITQYARTEYIRFLILDFLFITIYGLFFSTALFFLLHRLFPLKPRLAYLSWLGLLAALVDYLEGGLFLTLLFQYPTPVPAAANAAGIITGLKLLLFSLCMGLMCVLFVAWIIRLRTNRTLKASI